jgi:hypothetical protein
MLLIPTWKYKEYKTVVTIQDFWSNLNTKFKIGLHTLHHRTFLALQEYGKRGHNIFTAYHAVYKNYILKTDDYTNFIYYLYTKHFCK